MPSTVAHALTSFSSGMVLHALSYGRFTALHVFLIVLHSTNGPDIGSVVEFLLSSIAPAFGTFFMHVVHSPFGYPFTLGLLWVWLGVYLSRRDLRHGGASMLDFRIVMRVPETQTAWRHMSDTSLDGGGAGQLSTFDESRDDDEDPDSDAPLSPTADVSSTTFSEGLTFFKSWLLAVAGCLLHFRLDTLYEDNGADPLYRAIIDTGYWLPGANDIIYRSVGVSFALSLGILIATHTIVHTSLRSTLPGIPSRLRAVMQTWEGRVCVSAAVCAVVAVAYCLFVWSRLNINPRVPAVGEEADLGVILFEAATGLLPLALCAWSTTTG
ncbi:hypothetical protein HKX48_000598 [Thoreauomyces humboldtii]|nr:hypothetical protein HKX48_000598 [Thoreauomyces humboldtii]